MKKRLSLFLITILGISTNIYAQCVQCDGSATHLGTNASVIGTSTAAGGHSAFASGYNSTASGNYSTAMGYDASATGMYSAAIGKNVRSQNTAYTFGRDITASGSNSIIIGCGYSSSAVLTNSIAKSIMLGVGSSSPAMIIRQQSTNDVPAFVGVATSDPKQELHVNGNAMISGSGKSLLFATSASSTYGNFGIRYTGSGLNFYLPNSGTPTNYLMFIKNNGNIGVGTSNPSCKFDVSGSLKATSMQSTSLSVSGGVTFSSLASNSTKVVTINSNGELLTTEFSTFQDNLGNHTADKNINLNGNKIIGSNSGNGGIYVSSDGKVRIGTGSMAPSNALEVNGTIRSKEVVIELTNWSDFVFENDYKLMSLKETESYIKKNGHLPDVPSAEEVMTNGVELGEMNAVLLQKIEELTLYVIELEKKIEKLENK